MAVTQNEYTGNGSTTTYSFTFPYLQTTDVKVKLDGVTQATTAYTFPTATTVQMNSAPGNNVKVLIYRDTGNDNKKATFYPGSAIKAEDLNDDFDQILYTAQEIDNYAMTTLGDDTMIGNLQMGENQLVFEGATADAHETSIGVVDPTADRTINFPNVSGTVITTGDTGTVTSTILAANSVDSSELVDGSIDTSHIADLQVTTAKIAADAVTGAKIADDSIDSEHYVDGSIDHQHLASGSVTSVKLQGDVITADKIADDAVQDEHINANAVTTQAIFPAAVTTDKIADNAVTTAKINADAITGAKIADDQINSEHYVDGSIDTAHIADDQITTAKIAADAINATKIADDAVQDEHLNANAVTSQAIFPAAVTTDKIADDAVTTAKLADAELTTLAGMPTATASALADSTALDVSTTEINRVVKNKYVETSITNSDNAYPTSGAVIDYVAAQIAPLGGLEVIANEDNFPATQPASGVVISIADAGGIVVNGSGVSTTARTAGNGSDNVTINGFPSALYSTTLVDNMGLLVSSTGSSNTYTYHKLLGKEDDIKQLSSDINDFKARYRVGSSNPSSDNDAGDLFFNTATDKLLVRNAANNSWEEAQSVGNFYISTLSPAFDGSTTDFTITNAPTYASQILLIINGVLQKPNAGTSAPADGFAIDGSTIKLGGAPATGSTYSAVVIGSTVNIGTPSDNTVSTAIIQNLAVTTDKIAADAVTAAKIADDAVGAEHIELLDAPLHIADSTNLLIGTGSDLKLWHHSDHSYIRNETGNLTIEANSAGDDAIKIIPDGAVELYHDNNIKLETTNSGVKVTGQLTVPQDFVKLDDSVELYLGNDNDLEIYHQTDSFIKNGTGVLRILADSFQVDNNANSEVLINAVADGAVELYHAGDKKFETTAAGVTTTGQAYAAADLASNYAGKFFNDGASFNRYGVLIQCGQDSPSSTNVALCVKDGDGTTQGHLLFTNGTLSLDPFTAAHPCIVPDADNPSDESMAYPYGTLLETTDIEYKKNKNGSSTERGIIYKVQKTQSANSKKVLGAYSGSMNNGPDNDTNMHHVYVLGDGHILVNNAGGNIEVGDGICSSATAGIGQKATANPSMIIGIAQEAVTFTGSETKLVAVQYGLQQFIPWT